jgi:hypothetical protein
MLFPALTAMAVQHTKKRTCDFERDVTAKTTSFDGGHLDVSSSLTGSDSILLLLPGTRADISW